MDETTLKNCADFCEQDIKIIGAEDVQKFLGKSLSWVYKHYQKLGGRRVAGAIVFPSERKI